MSVFDTAVACTQNMLECLNQNLFETPPYGPVPDASRKLRTAVDGMLDALTIAQSAESQGIAMPPAPEMPAEEVEGFEAHLRQEHTLHREHASALDKQEGGDGNLRTLTQWRAQTSTDQELLERARQDEARKQQAEAARRRQLSDNRGREEALRQQAQDRSEQEKQERDRQSQAQQERDRQTQGQTGQQPGQQPGQLSGPEQQERERRLQHEREQQEQRPGTVSDEERQRSERERSRQEQELQRQRSEQADRERHARESAEHERQFVAQAQPGQPPSPPRSPEHTPGRE